jgi:mannose-6-phosphate isomerase-like protein (cupin superfamily)
VSPGLEECGMADGDDGSSERVLDEGKTIELGEALARLPGFGGERFATIFEHGSLSVEIYAPRGVDPQKPHTRDEAYVVVEGEGEFVHGQWRERFTPGALLFAPAGLEHRFENITEDLVVWVIFYGPEGGEAAPSAGESDAP